MKEFQTPFVEGFSKGLRPYTKMPRNSQFLTTCYNARCGKSGLEEYTAITVPFTGLPAVSWPFPTAINTSIGMFIINGTTLYQVNSNYSLTSLLSGITGSGLWSVADFADYQVWTNGTKILEKAYVAGTGLYTWKISSETYTINSVCNFRGQLIAGGISSSRGNQVFYSKIGHVDLSHLLTFAAGEDKSAGMFPCLWNGNIYTVKPLGNNVIVYGSAGITAMVAISSPYSGFGRKEISRFGIAGRGAVAGDEKQHIFIDEGYKLWTIGEDLIAKELGYHEYMTLLTGTIVISFDSDTRDFYISNGTITYLLSEHGLSQIFQHPTSLIFIQGGLIGVKETDSADTTFLSVTDVIDMQNRNIKTITEYEIGITNITGSTASSVTAAVDYRYSTTSAFTRSSYKTANARGIVMPIISGLEFRHVIKASSYVGVSLDYVNVKWKQSDKRGIRGAYATTNA